MDVEAAAGKFPEIQQIPFHIAEMISQGEEGKQQLARLAEQANSEDSLFLPEDSLEFGPCVPEPQKIIGIGLNPGILF
ncbi:hypothetical protein [Effusibacillus consociatus]|uniref:Uncharacterized protein n=1 Tax=Effusibacillus consociatus TaxID=1117041 RepID=A0ABV9PZ94_9BACL